MTKTFTIALFACALSSTAMSAQQKDQSKDKSGTYSQPAEQQPVIMPAGQRPEEWKFGKEKEAEAKKAVEDKKLAKKKAEEDKKAAAEAKKKAEAERKLAAKAAKEETEKKRVEDRRAAEEQKKAAEQQRAADARAEREAAAAKKAEEQKAADEQRAAERREAAEKAAEERRAEAEKAAADVREKEAREAAKKSAARKSSAKSGNTPPVAAASPAAPAGTPATSTPAAKPTPAAPNVNQSLTSVASPSTVSSAPAKTSASAPAAAPASSGAQDQTGSQATAAQPAAGDATPAADGKSVDPMRPPAIIRAEDQPDAWKMRSEGGTGQLPQSKSADGKSSDGKSSDARSASVTTGQSKPSSSAPPKPKQPWRGWSDRALISLNAGYQAASFDLRDTRSFEPPIPGDREQRTLNADYSVESGMSIDFGGAYRVWRALAAGVSVTRFKDSRDVPVTGSIPHPFFFNRARSITGATSGARQEMAVHVDAMWVVPIRPKMTLAVFGGPSFYSVKQTVVSDYDYNQTYPYDDVTLTRVISADESSSVTGVNFGADVGYYFTDMIGVGGLIRFGRASVDTSIGSLDVGGPEFGVGLRIRIPPARPKGRAITPQPPPTTTPR